MTHSRQTEGITMALSLGGCVNYGGDVGKGSE
jgi:hypothetical protein